jgi:7,8-dihydro-6-hydroxymethylpterin-pyrophosphokinase
MAIENIGRTHPRLEEVDVSIKEAGQVGCHPASGILQGSAVGAADDGQELVNGVVSIDSKLLTRKILQVPGLDRNDIGKIDTHWSEITLDRVITIWDLVLHLGQAE